MVLDWMDHTNVGCCAESLFLPLSLLTAGQMGELLFSSDTPNPLMHVFHLLLSSEQSPPLLSVQSLSLKAIHKGWLSEFTSSLPPFPLPYLPPSLTPSLPPVPPISPTSTPASN